MKEEKIKVIIALVTSTSPEFDLHLAIRFSLESFLPFFTAGSRHMLVGLIMFMYMRWRGTPPPTKAQWKGSAIIGTFLLLGGTGGVVYAMQWVGSGTAAVVIATTPLWTVLFAGIWKQWPAKNEWIGLVLGLTGIVLLNVHGDLRAHPGGAILLLLSAASWAFGSVLSLRLTLPSGAMASALQMFSGGLVVLIVGFVTGEQFPANPSIRSVSALIYLAIFGSFLG
jgi:drug/metabolite transporter (DMT)-like permease